MKIIILFNSHKYSYHVQISNALHDLLSSYILNIQMIDISTATTLSAEIMTPSTNSPSIIITLDLSGFELRTLTGECTLNTLPCKVLNIIWGDKSEYKPYLSKKISLSMLFYDATGENHMLNIKYPNLRYYFPMPEAIELTSENSKQTAVILQSVLSHFKKETLLD